MIAQTATTAALALAGAWYVHERSLRRTRPMEGGLHADIALPHQAEFELWHNAFSLCSKKVRFCLAELDVDYVAHPIDLIETGSYETLSRAFLAVNPAAQVPVLVHRGHPVYESHEIIRYAAAHAAGPTRLVPEEPGQLATMERWVRRSSLWGDNPMLAMDESAGNCIPGLTIPLFTAMVASIPAWRIGEGLLFHRLKQRAVFFLAMKAFGLGRIHRVAPLARAVRRSRDTMQRHLGDLEAHLARAAVGGNWICGPPFTLADVSWAVIFDRLREAGWDDLLESPARAHVSAWWQRIRQRPGYAASMLGDFAHPLVTAGSKRIRQARQENTAFRETLYG